MFRWARVVTVRPMCSSLVWGLDSEAILVALMTGPMTDSERINSFLRQARSRALLETGIRTGGVLGWCT